MTQFLNWLDGKKTYVLAVLSAINALLSASNVYNAQVAGLVQGILSLLLGGAKIASDKLGIGK